MSMELLMKENLFDDVLEVSSPKKKEEIVVEEDLTSTAVEEPEDDETEFEELKDTDHVNSVVHSEVNEDPLLDTTKSFQSMDLGPERDESLKSNHSKTVPVRAIPSQDSMQKLRSEEASQKRPSRRSRRRRRRRSLKDSIASLFSSSSHRIEEEEDPNLSGSKSRNNKRTPSPRDPQRTKRTERSPRFFSSSAFLKRRSVLNRKKHGQRRFSALSLEFDLFHSSDKMDRRSMPLRQSSSTAFTSAALEVSQVFDREQLEADRELDEQETSDELSTPFGRQVVY